MASPYVFGTGDLILTPAAAPFPANPTPIKLGTLQDCSVDFAFSQKELFGKLSFPVAIARTQGKITCKSKNASIYSKALNDYFFGNSVVAGEAYFYVDEVHTPASGTATVTNATGGIIDQGVVDGVTGAPLTEKATPGVGQYSVVISTGVYTFNSADTTAKKISYLNTPSGTPGYSAVIVNPAMGSQPTFSVVLCNNQYQSNRIMIQLNSCISSKLTLGFKNEDYMIPEFDFSAFSDTSGNIGTISADN